MLVALVILLLSSPAPSAGDRSFCNNDNGTYKPNSTYMSNLSTLAEALISNATKAHSHSATGTTGTGSDKVYGAVLCRGDSTDTDCARRLREAFDGAINADSTGAAAVCALHKDVALYSELYQLRFSDEDFLSAFSNAPEWVDDTNLNLVPATETEKFDELVTKLMRTLAEGAGRQPDRYATDDAPWPSQERERTVYGMAQCTQDMTPERCRSCLDGIIAEWWQKMGGGKMGGAIHGVRCTLRYETDTQFFTATGKATEGPCTLDHWYSFLSLDPLYTLAFLYPMHQKPTKRGKVSSMEQPENMDEVLRLWKIEDAGSEFSLYDFSQIAYATDNFSPDNILGEGGFGPVYKGVFPDGQEVAIKKLAARSRQGLGEFKNEIQLVAKLQHKNLVRLLGCCVHDEEKILIYEYLANKSLDYFIFDPTRRTSLNWKIRIKIVEGIAQGLLYLHEHSRVRIIHRDLKASNILLDSGLNPKISDFGMARIFPLDATQANASRLVGTFGYMAPEYASEGLLSIKSDVFSFGVLLLEIISGKKSAGFQHYGEFHNLLEYAWKMWKNRRWHEFIDQSFADEYEPGVMMKYLTLALMCVQEKSVDRPTMSEVVAMLSSDDITLPEPRQPAYSYIRVDVSVNVNASCSRNDVTITTIDGR